MSTSQKSKMSWPPQYRIRKSTRAKYVHLQINRYKGLEVVVPKRARTINVLSLLEDHREWIDNKLAEYNLLSRCNVIELPDQLQLRAIHENWRISYQSVPGEQPRITEQKPFKLVIMGDMRQSAAIQSLIAQWLKKKAKLHLKPWLSRLSLWTGLRFSQMSVRGQTSRWGSCSETKRISLNYKLLFLPSMLTEHILLHELCHLKHLDHSNAFWDLLTKYDMNTQFHREAMTRAELFVPDWIEYDFT